MPFVLLALGVLFFVVSIQGTQGTLFSLLKSEFVGSNSFVVWAAALIILGLLGYIRPIRPITHAFMVLIILVLIIANGGGFFTKFNQAIRSPTAPAAPSPATGAQAATPLLGSAAAPVQQSGGWGTGLTGGSTAPGTGYIDTTSTF